MKVFFRKLKKCNKIALIIYLISFIAYAIGLIFLSRSVLSLSGIETALRIVLLILLSFWFFAYLLGGIVSLFTKKYKTFSLISFITILFVPFFFFASYYVDAYMNEIEGISKEYLTYSSNLISLKDTELTSDSKIGMINDERDIEGYVLAKKIIEKNKLKQKIVEYDDYYVMLDDLYAKKIDALFITSNYVLTFAGEENFEAIDKETKVIYEYSEKMKNQDNVVISHKKLTEPFTILLLGVDSEKDGLDASQAFNGDTLMMMTFNPKTLSATMFSIPRDMYVPISCRNGAKAKINSSAARGTKCVMDTIKDFTGISIDYYVKVNFKAVVDLVDKLGGITVDVEKPWSNKYNGKVCEQNSDREFGGKLVCMSPGIQTLSGEQALAYARCRHLYLLSDIDRIRHQQQVVEATAQSLKKLRSLNDFKDVLEVVKKNIDTNMTTNQILSLYDVGKNILLNSLSGSDELVTIQKSYLEYYNLPVRLPNGNVTSALGYYKSSLSDITHMMKVNLGLEEQKPITTFSFSYNETYTGYIAGKGKKDNSKEETVPSFKGKTLAEAQSWGTAHNITIIAEKVSSDNPHYNSLVGSGLIGNQSVAFGTFLNGITSITVYINNSTTPNANNGNTTSTEPNQNETKDPDKKPNDTDDPLPNDIWDLTT